MLHAIGFDKVFERAEGAYYCDADGNHYPDFLSGFGVFAVGPQPPGDPPGAARRARRRAGRHGPVRRAAADGPARRAAARPAPGMERVFFCNSGTEAVEAALKFARYATGRAAILYCDHAFHGLTAGSLSVNGAAGVPQRLRPAAARHAESRSATSTRSSASSQGRRRRPLIEPIQGKGVHMPPDGFLPRRRNVLLTAHGALLIADEVQSGFGRTGKFFAYRARGASARHRHRGQGVVRRLRAGRRDAGHGPVSSRRSTPRWTGSWCTRHVQGNALAMTAGLATLQVLDDEELVENAARTGARSCVTALTAIAERFSDARRRAGPRPDDRHRVRQASALRGKASWNMLRQARIGLFAQMVVVPLFTGTASSPRCPATTWR